MANFRKIGVPDQAGYDEARALQVLPVGQHTTFYLIAGGDLDVSVDDPDLVALKVDGGDDKAAHRAAGLSSWEKANSIRKIVVKANHSEGQTTLRAKLPSGADNTQPITLRIVHDQYWRQVGNAASACPPEFRREIQGLSLREAVLRVAEDQMHSAISWRTDGFGKYTADATYDWCGAFVYWCWRQAAAIKGVTNPIGSNESVLWSPQRAIHWAIDPTSAGLLLRYKGGDPFLGKGTQDYVEIGQGGNLEPADIVLMRGANAGNWVHVCMIEKVVGTTLVTMNGNQSPKGLPPPSIKIVNRARDQKLADGSYKMVFVHVLYTTPVHQSAPQEVRYA